PDRQRQWQFHEGRAACAGQARLHRSARLDPAATGGHERDRDRQPRLAPFFRKTNRMAETGARKWIIVITAIMASLIELIDTSIVNVALPQMMGNLSATLDEVAWVVTAYVVANVIVVPMTGFLSRFFGRRNYFAGSIVLFTVASFFCGHATNIWELVTFRFIQGIGGGALFSTSQAILVETFPPEELGLANGLFGLGVVMGPTIGP